MLEITLDRIHVQTKIGVYDWEQNQLQDLFITVKMQLLNDVATKSDALDDTVDYELLQNTVKHLIESNAYALIEKVAFEIHTLVLSNPLVASVRVAVEKPSALKHTDTVRVVYQ